jgi:phage terminase large subunit-like protein
MFSQGLIYAPARDWSELAITEISMFPAGRYDDLTDSVPQALKYLRDVGLANTDEEEHHTEIETVMHRQRLPTLYPC